MDVSLAPLRTMEPRIVERLRLAFPGATFVIERVPSVLTVREFERVVKLTPFLGLAWMGVAPAKANGRQFVAAWQWRLILIVKASGGDERRFKGDHYDIGLDAMSDVAMVLLQGAELPGIGHVTVTRAEAVYAEGWSDDATVVSQIDFEISTTSTLARLQLVTPEDFERLGITWAATAADDPAAAAAPVTVTIEE